MIRQFLLLFLVSILLANPFTVLAQTTNDVTSKIEKLGNQAAIRWPNTIYPRNVWDMQSFNGKVYIGSGDSGANSGPVPIILYNPQTGLFTTEGTNGGDSITEEQLDSFRLIDFGTGNQLVIPGRDMRGIPDTISWYRLEQGVWILHTGGPSVPHIYDIYRFNGQLFAAMSSNATPDSIHVSVNNGATWSNSNIATKLGHYLLFEIGGKLYTNRSILGMGTSADTSGFKIYEYSGTGTTFNGLANIHFGQIFPSTPTSGLPSIMGLIKRAINFDNSLVYVGASFVNGTQWAPFGIYKVDQVSPTGGANWAHVTRINLQNNASPYDILNVNGKLYVLGAVQNGSRYWVTVSSSTDLTNWTEEFRFDSPTFARSFEYLNGSWYFGLGTDATTLSAATGDILRYKETSATPSPSAPAVKPGDIDGNGKVDIFDYSQLLSDFGKSGIFASDIDKNGKVDIFDYNLLLTNFGK